MSWRVFDASLEEIKWARSRYDLRQEMVDHWQISNGIQVYKTLVDNLTMSFELGALYYGIVSI